MQIEGPKQQVNKSQQETYQLLGTLENFERLMPENLQKFEVLNEDTFKFGLSGMPEIILKLKEKHPHRQIVLGAASDKLPFTLVADINEVSENVSEVVLRFEGQFNAMMGMMIKTPITNFINTLTINLSKL